MLPMWPLLRFCAGVGWLKGKMLKGLIVSVAGERMESVCFNLKCAEQELFAMPSTFDSN